jgi:hypothetical protein
MWSWSNPWIIYGHMLLLVKQELCTTLVTLILNVFLTLNGVNFSYYTCVETALHVGRDCGICPSVDEIERHLCNFYYLKTCLAVNDNLWTHAIASKTRALYNTGYSHFELYLTLNGVNFSYLIKSVNSCRRVSIIFILIA